jgi:N-acetylneuraminic acid mutarotase
MKKLLLFIAVINLFQAKSQSAQFAWIKGSSANYQYGVYGTQGVSNATNLPGFRSDHVSWTNNTGSLWMFGGTGYAVSGAAGQLNDLWKYNVSLNEWTWMKGPSTINQIGAYGTKGISSATTTPGSRYSSATWIDNSGNLWLFGGNGRATTVTTGYLNDLWKFDVTTNEWTWMSGSNAINQVGTYGTKGVPTASTIPGGRYDAVTWIDNSGNLWLHGGNGLATTGSGGLLNDLWKYNVLTNQWTWVSGGNAINSVGTYGTKGTSGPSNVPGGRSGAKGFKDSNGDLWIYGGNGIPASIGVGMLCDLWKYSFANNQWTWMSGTSFGGSVGVYGSKGFPSASNYPGGRMNMTSWVDSQNNFWLYGGYGAGSVAGNGALNDLWMYNALNNTWVWTSGANSIGQVAVYGTQGVSSATNTPGGRYKSSSWTDNAGAFWLYGGSVVGGERSDLWKIDVCLAPASPSAASQTICVGSSGTLTATGTANLGWYSGATGGTYLGNGSVYVTPTLTSSVTYYVQDSLCAQSLRTPVVVTATQPTITIAGTNTVCSNSSATLTASGASTYTWSTSQVTNTISVAPTSTTIYTVTGTDAFGCISTKTKTLTTIALPAVAIAGSGSVCAGSGLFLTASGANTYTWNTGSTATSILAAPASSFVYTVTGRTTSTGCVKTQTALVTVQQVTATITGNFSVCLGSTSVLTASGANSYTWTSNVIGAAYGPTVTAFPSASFNYSLTAKDLQGCTKTQTFVVSPLANPTVSIIVPATHCAGTNITLTGAGASTYTWQPGNIVGTTAVVSPTTNMSYSVTGSAANTCTNSTSAFISVNAKPNISIVSTPSVICAGASVNLSGAGGITNGYTWSTGATTFSTLVSPSVTTTYSLIGTAVNTCTNSAVKTITVNPLPTLTVTGNNVLCAGNSTTLTASGANTYTWSAGFLVPTIGVTPLSSTNYSVIGKDANNCTNTTTYSVTVNALPVVIANATTSSVCIGSNVTLTGAGASTYTWTNGVIDGVSFTPSTTASYTVSGTDLNGCVNSAPLLVTVNNLPIVTANSTSTLACLGDNLVLTGGGASTYTWTGSVLDATPFIAAASDSYTVTGVDANGCINTATVSISVNICTGIQQLTANSNSVLVFPNPNNGEFTIQSHIADVINVTNELGQVVETVELTQQNNFSYKVNHFSNGIYFLVGKTIKQKVIVSK